MINSIGGEMRFAVLVALIQEPEVSMYKYFPELVPGLWSILGPVPPEFVPPESTIQS